MKLCEDSETLLKVPKTRCVFKFGKNAKDWKQKKEKTDTERHFSSFDTFECNLKFPAQDSENAVLEIDNRICVEIDRKVFLNALKFDQTEK